MTCHLLVTPRDPLIARDGRPFGANAGNRMRSLDWLYPSVVAGSLRTLLGKQAGLSFEQQDVDALKGLSIAGPLPFWQQTLFLPRPLDAVVREGKEDRACLSARPAAVGAGEGCNLPNGLRPVLLPDDSEDFKPARQPAFWSLQRVSEWLGSSTGTGAKIPPTSGAGENGFLSGPPLETRTHVKMNALSGAGEEGQLFSTAALDFSSPKSGETILLAIRVDEEDRWAAALSKLNALHPLGGERRLAHWAIPNDNKRLAETWKCPSEVVAAFAKNPLRVRMVLATPAIFSGGWKPGWLDGGEHGLTGSPPGVSVKLRLTGFVSDRWRPLSGWSLENPVGPKPVRRLVPAGSVYFFEVCEGDPSQLTRRWLESVCDTVQDRRDGFGLALWGLWDEHSLSSKGV